MTAVPTDLLRQAILLVLLVFTPLIGVAEEISADENSWVGLSLTEALNRLQDEGLNFFFTSNVVPPYLKVTTQPTSQEPRDRLEELLNPHGLTARTGAGGRLIVVVGEPEPAKVRGTVRSRDGTALPGVAVLIADRQTFTDAEGAFLFDDLAPGDYRLEARLPGFVVAQLREVRVRPRQIVEVDVELAPAPVPLDEIIVTPSFVSLLREEPVSSLHLDQDEIFALPHLGDDIFRAFTLMPGVAGEEVSAKFNVRGGRTDEVLVILDRAELYEPYHLKDFGSALSIVAPKALQEVKLITGGFSARYGDRMSGVLDMSTERPSRLRRRIGFGLLSSELAASGEFADGSAHWLALARRGSLDLALKMVGERERPRYWDAFGKLGWAPRETRNFALSVLHSDDLLDFFEEEEDEIERMLTSYNSSYLWLTHQEILGSRLFVDSTLSFGRVRRDRQGIESEEDEGSFDIADRRRLDALTLKQDWMLQISDRRHLSWGFDVRDLETAYDYQNFRDLEDPFEDIRPLPRVGTTTFFQTLQGDQAGIYVIDRRRFSDRITAEFGFRWDRHDLTDDRLFSPRLNLAWNVAPTSTLRLAWGYFFQTQRPYELAIEDGETLLSQAERTVQSVAGFDHVFTIGEARRNLLLRIEAYYRDVRDPRVRYENLFDPISKFPEIEKDRFRIAPLSSRTYGVEVLLHGEINERMRWRASYAWARALDRIDGRDVPRRFDQPHTVNLNLDVEAWKGWHLNFAWRHHTGWPTTELFARIELDDDGEPEAVPFIGEINAERLPTYHRLDLRASREWNTKRGDLGFFVEIQNVYNRKNVSGFDSDFDADFDEDAPPSILTPEVEIWGELLPSFGITWEF